MSTGLLALLDDIAALAKVAAVALDDAAALTAKAGSKSIGVIVDDAAVTPRYVIGFAADRELPIIRKIAIGSLKNKFLFLLPGAIVLGWAVPWLITPILMLGACYLCYEGYGKIHDYLFPSAHTKPSQTDLLDVGQSKPQLEQQRVSSAIRTDFILSAEIMAITYASITEQTFIMQAVVLAAVAFAITFLVYGVVAIIVKADDFGLFLAQRTGKAASILNPIGRAIVRAMPPFLKGLSILGTVAMLYVGGDILVHSISGYGFHQLENVTRIIPYGFPFMTVLLGIVVGSVAALFAWPIKNLLAKVPVKS